MISIFGLAVLAINLVFGTFVDSSFNTSKTSFAPGETVHFKLSSGSSGEKEKRFDLLDEQKNKIFSLDVAVSGTSPYIYTSSFRAPQASGVYYIDVKLDDGKGVSFAGQRNINVGLNSNGEVKSEVTSESNVNVNINSSTQLEGEGQDQKEDEEDNVLSFYADKLEEPLDIDKVEQEEVKGFVGVLVNRINKFVSREIKDFIEKNLPSWARFW